MICIIIKVLWIKPTNNNINVKNKDIQESSDILRIECKVGYEYREKICKMYNIEPINAEDFIQSTFIVI